MAWTDPRTWVTGETVTSSLLNVHLRDNLDYLFAHASLTAFDYPATCDVRQTNALASVGTSNDCHYNRVYHGGVVDTIRINVGVSNGNIGVAVYNQSGSGATATPNVRQATSGSIVCPASGNADVALGGTVTLGHATHWFGLSANGTTATFRSAGAIPAGWHNGVNGAQATGHPPPDPAAASASRASQLFVMIGLP